MKQQGTPVYRFGRFRLDVSEQQLLQDGRSLPLTPKVFDVLRVLVQNSGHLVEKERLLAEVWPDSFVEEGALSRSISILRKTLSEAGSDQQYIETIPKRGYRFVARVSEWMPGDAEESGAPANRTSGASRATQPASTPNTLVMAPARVSVASGVAGAAAVIAITLALLAAVVRQNERETPAVTTPAPVHRQLTFTGTGGAPTVSPDGRRIAYVSHEKPEKKLIVQELAGGPPLTIFTAPEIGYLRWSPDGTELILWMRGSGNGVYVLPQLGGTPRRIVHGQFIACWSPDGSAIAVASYMKGNIWFFDKLGRLQRTVSVRDVNGSIDDIDWSVNGLLTFVGKDYRGQYTIWTTRPDGSDQRRLIAADSQIPSVRWTRDGDAIYYFRRVNQTFSLMKLSVEAGRQTQAGTPTTLIAGLESDRFFALSGDGRRLVYARAPYYSNLWLVEAGRVDNERTAPHELTRGTSLIERPSVSPDGTSIVFNMGQSAANLYTMPITGGVPKQLTFLDSLNLGAVWSADGRQIAFASTTGGQPGVWAVDAGGGMPRVLSSTNISDTFDLTWAPGSRILYQQSGNRDYYELDPATRAQRLLVKDSLVGWISSPIHSRDGRRVAAQWNRPPSRGLWVIDTTDGRETPVYETSASVVPLGWSVDGRSIYALEGKPLNFRGLTAAFGETLTNARVVRVPVNGDNVKTLVTVPFEEIGGVSMTPDGRSFICVVYSSGSDVWVVDDFDASR